ncbi:hypothetical protein SAMN05192583_2499 [Sphingomonas gellani]|uniref:Anti-sigma factor NepR domain-containing protein n=1 Tax=Sphingomonas gellani TaxID=1166340 RepID=A0A1H8FMJ5_9SPHN|nr:NepR family anti-sigma factor [Sphingomonas gellani]SEN32932.1 hypothetical protein SAMN05192583_2499 [Sphingomonas gellani]
MKPSATPQAAGEKAEVTQRRTSDKNAASGGAGQDRDMGSALRSVYQCAVDEAIPDDLLDLLGKLD